MGSGFKTFTAGSILTASDVQNYLQDQAVMVFGGTAARSSAIGTANFEEGMLTYLTDVDKLQVYTGASFVDVYPAAATNQGLTLINTTSFSGVVTQSINDVFSTTYTNYRILLRLTSAGATGNCNMRFRVSGADNTTNNYYSGFAYDRFTNATGNGAGNPLTAFVLPAMTNTGQIFSFSMDVLQPFTTNTTLISYTGTGQDATSGYSMNGAGYHEVSSSFTGFTLINNAGNLGTGSVSVYGYNV